MNLSITSNYLTSEGCAEPYLRKIAEAGFSHVHWGHHWHTDYLYSDSEIIKIKKCLKEYGLRLLDLHGPEKLWFSPLEDERLKGVELVKNRIIMTQQLSSDVVILHTENSEGVGDLNYLRMSLDVLCPFAKKHNILIALENYRDFEIIKKLLSEYGPEYVGLCYDSGHGNLVPNGLDFLESFKERLISVHLHDNDGNKDLHKIPFSGTVDWERLTRIMAKSAYTKCVSLETGMFHTGISSEEVFLRESYKAGEKLTKMIYKQR